jgi:hypothetical protein
VVITNGAMNSDIYIYVGLSSIFIFYGLFFSLDIAFILPLIVLLRHIGVRKIQRKKDILNLPLYEPGGGVKTGK